MRASFCAVGTLFLLASVNVALAQTQPVPKQCSAAVNAGLVQFVTMHTAAGQEAEQDNVLVCGTALRASYAQHAGHSGTGSHHVMVLSVPTSGAPLTVEVVTNDALDGVVTARAGDLVYALGQAYVDAKPIRAAGLAVAAGVHDTHCSTHAGAEDGWVVVQGKRYPANGCQGAH